MECDLRITSYPHESRPSNYASFLRQTRGNSRGSQLETHAMARHARAGSGRNRIDKVFALGRGNIGLLRGSVSDGIYLEGGWGHSHQLGMGGAPHFTGRQWTGLVFQYRAPASVQL